MAVTTTLEPISLADSRSSDATMEVAGINVPSHNTVYAVLVIAVGLILLTFLFTGTPLSTSLKLMFLAILILTLRRWTAALLLALMQLHQCLTESAVPPEDINFTVHIMWVILSTLIVMAISRYRTLSELDGRSLSSQIPSLFRPIAPNERLRRAAFILELRTGVLQAGRSLLMLTACAIAAWFLMSLVPLEETIGGRNTISEYRLRPGGYRVLMLGLMLFVGYLIVWLLVNEFFWRRLSRQQAAVFLRSTMVGWLHGDLRMLILKQLKIRRQRQRSATSAEPEIMVPGNSAERFVAVTRSQVTSN